MCVEKLLEEKGDNVVTCPPSTLVAEAVRLMRHHAVGAIAIADPNDRLAGLLSERDVTQGLAIWGGSSDTSG
ncbi:MAG: CBS domain-containing protein [Alphaproteobacteria bacterium]|nr:CBS domain-containing protein [Alphaproteobacteria bacterium]